ncbi:uncharacterized protein [Periplaneta americana]|uniref:uncharacterized protein n=1 Tax=Periplaneta americana TaxID=6978 RepID=UPI0037E9A928
MSYYSEECVDQARAIMPEVKVEDPIPISDRMVKEEPEARDVLDHDVTDKKEEYEDQSQDLTSEIKFEEDPVLKREPEERNFLDHHVSDIKEEYMNQSPDLISEIKFEEDPVPISFPVVKCKPEEEQSDLDTVNEDPRMDLTAENNESLTETIAATNEGNVSSEFDSVALQENGTSCEIPKNSGCPGKPVWTDDDEKQLEFELHKISSSNSAKLKKKPFKCEFCGKCFTDSVNFRIHNLMHTGEKPFKCDDCGKLFSNSKNLRSHMHLHNGQKAFKCDVCGVSRYRGA